ncbi:MAG: response regulator [Deinococcales bacterium]
MRLLVAEDEAALRHALVSGLLEEGYIVDAVDNGESAVFQAVQVDYDILILDINLPRLDGFAVCKQLRDLQVNTRILILTARDGIQDRILGLDVGADDYLVKPFAFEELLARLRALLRRAPSHNPILEVGDLRLNPATKQVARSGRLLQLSAREYALLEFLMRHADQVVNRVNIARAIMPNEAGLDSNVVDVFVSYLRNKVDKPFAIRLIHTVRGMGYVLRTPKV